MEHKGTCLLETDRLYLGRFTMKDVHAVYENWAKDPHVTKFLSWPAHVDPGLTRQILLEWIESYLKPDFYQWSITLKDCPETRSELSAQSRLMRSLRAFPSDTVLEVPGGTVEL